MTATGLKSATFTKYAWLQLPVRCYIGSVKSRAQSYDLGIWFAFEEKPHVVWLCLRWTDDNIGNMQLEHSSWLETRWHCYFIQTIWTDSARQGLQKFTVNREQVIRENVFRADLPSSKTWRSRLNTSLWAFSISSRSIKQCGCRFTASVSVPGSPYPTYPGGAPISFATECCSMYSLMSNLTCNSDIIQAIAIVYSVCEICSVCNDAVTCKTKRNHVMTDVFQRSTCNNQALDNG